MKKLLLTGIMILSASAFAGTGLESKEAVVDIKAKVIKPLDIKTTPLDFGILLPGESKYSENPGVITITGTAGENIKLFVKEAEGKEYKPNLGPREVYNVTLTTGNGESENEKLATELTLFTPGIAGDKPNDGVWLLEKDGEKVFTLAGNAKTTVQQKEGIYKGRIYVKAMYQ